MNWRKLFLILCLGMTSILQAQYEREAIEEVIREAYVNGSFNVGIERNVELGFSKDFRRVVLGENGELEISDYYDWLRELRNRDFDENGRMGVRYLRNDIRRDIAQLSLQFLIDNKVVRTEYMTLMQFPSGWKIVSLTYQKEEEK